MNIIQNILKEEIKFMLYTEAEGKGLIDKKSKVDNYHSDKIINNMSFNAEQAVRMRNKFTPESYYNIEDDSEDGYITSYYVEEEFDYVEEKAKRVGIGYFALDPKWKPSKGFSDLYSLTGKILKNPKAIELFMLEPQTDKQKYVKQKLLEWFKTAKSNNILNITPFLVQLVEINKNYQIQKRAQG